MHLSGVTLYAEKVGTIRYLSRHIYFSTLQHTATHCNRLQRNMIHCNTLKKTHTLQHSIAVGATLCTRDTHCNKHAAIRCDTLQLTATRCNAAVFATRTASGGHVFLTGRNTLQHTATHCNTLQHTATHCNTLKRTHTQCNTPQHTATQPSLRRALL